MARILLRGGHVLTMDRGLGDLETGDVLVDGTRIAAVGCGLEVDDAEIIDASGMIVMPGFVDTHRHTWQTQLRGAASDWTLFNYTTRIRLGYSSCYEPDDAYVGNFAGAIEAINAGVTTIVDHSHIMNSPDHADEALRGLIDSGIRAVFCYGLFPNPRQHPFRFEDFAPGWRLDDARRIRKDRLPGDDGPVYMGLAPAEVEKVPFEQACAEIRLGRELRARSISCHTAMSGYSSAFGSPLVTRLAQERLIGPDTIFVHGNALTPHELGIIADRGAVISSTPEVELQMGMGRSVVGKALRAGALVALGVDIVSNIPGDMFGPMRIALLDERADRNDILVAQDQVPRRLAMTCRDVVELATIGGAIVANLGSEIGSLTPGKRADIACIRRQSLNMMGADDPYAALVHYADHTDVDTVLVDGVALKRDGKLVRVREADIISRTWASRNAINTRFHKLNIDDFEDYYKGKYNFGN